MSYIDHLPIRPPIAPLQSISSFTADTLAANGNRSQPALKWLIGNGNIRRLLLDYPQPNEVIKALSQSLHCEPDGIRAATFYYLIRKFGLLETTTSAFLNGSISGYLRHCSPCLQEHPHFLLPWRFTILEGCPKHKVPLMSECSYCQKKIPITSGPIFDVRCPFCGNNLATQCSNAVLTAEQQSKAEHTFQFLEYLVTKQGFEHDPELPKYLGLQLQFIRKDKHLLGSSAAEALNWADWKIRCLENASQGRCFSDYLDYCSFLGITLCELFDTALAERRHRAKSITTTQLLTAIDSAFADLGKDGHRVLQQQIADHIGIKLDTLRGRKATAERLKAISAQQGWSDEELLMAMDVAFEALSQAGQYVTQQAIADHIGVTFGTLEGRKATAERLEAISAQQGWSDAELLTAMDNAFETLSQAGKYVTQQAIADHIGVTFGTLEGRKATVERLKAISAQQGWSDEELLIKIDDAFEALSQAGQYVTQQAIAGYIGIPFGTLRSRQAAAERLKAISAQQGWSDEELLIKMDDAFDTLKQTGQYVTQQAIADYIGIKLSTLSGRKGTREQLKTISAQQGWSDEELLTAMDDAVEALRQAGKSVTQQAIADHIGVTLNTLRGRKATYVHLQFITSQRGK